MNHVADDIAQAFEYGYKKGKHDTIRDCNISTWIPVTERLPDYDLVVLVTDGEDVGTGYRYALGETGFTGWAVPFADIEEDDISHWMPLPEPPKDGETWQKV